MYSRSELLENTWNTLLNCTSAGSKSENQYSFFTFTGPDLPHKIGEISQSMVISPDGMGIIIVGGYNHFSGGIDDPENIEYVREKRILQSRFDGSNFLPWQVMDQE